MLLDPEKFGCVQSSPVSSKFSKIYLKILIRYVYLFCHLYNIALVPLSSNHKEIGNYGYQELVRFLLNIFNAGKKLDSGTEPRSLAYPYLKQLNKPVLVHTAKLWKL